MIQNGRPVPKLLVLCRKYGIDVPDDVSPKELNDKLQQKWFKEGYLRYQIPGDPPKEDDLEVLRELGCIEAEFPSPTDYRTWDPDVHIKPPSYAVYQYEGVLILGALRARVVSRLHYLLSLCERLADGIEETDRFRLGKIYLLGGARPLDPVKEHPTRLRTPAELPFKEGWTPPEQMPTTEAEMMEFTWRQSQLPSEWKHELVNTPLQSKDSKNPEAGKRPPNTRDTVVEWIHPLPDQPERDPPKPGHYLVLSNQPFVKYQELTVQNAYRMCVALGRAPSGFTFSACGPKSSLTLPLATYLDNIAKQLYEELQTT
ncbi:MAG: hypothetical protein Q8R32_00995 [bacterium]|nr:hypothetical protein [bacterium]